ncbi:hypothetical protein EDM02_00835 [Candidatus Cardinium hertigii]|uniref:Uncharacterized protein n=1 Tax=Candidatus Cardinium hertigii TaxID=247481 RepID=A0A3N2QD68_9BACT|nr:hypothetical protein EDM02_00835 [Candidatus Cardinium hertigii]
MIKKDTNNQNHKTLKHKPAKNFSLQAKNQNAALRLRNGFGKLARRARVKRTQHSTYYEAVATGRQYNFFYFSSIIFCYF